MLCRRPYMMGAMPCPCGGCLPCRINRRRVWAHRILLESFKHTDSCFSTLTYDAEHCPEDLVKSDYQRFLKRFRRLVAPQKIRYFLAGEYGEKLGRPHFHLAIFGIAPVVAGGLDGRSGLVQSAWSLGFTHVGNLTWESAQYIAGYLTKKVVNHGDRSVPEFSRMSLRPGIGALAVGDIARALTSGDAGYQFVVDNGDVPTALQHGKRLLPLGRYLRRQLRGELGFANKDTPAAFTRMYVLRQEAEKIEERSALIQAGATTADAFKIMLDRRSQKIKNLEVRFRIRDSERSL